MTHTFSAVSQVFNRLLEGLKKKPAVPETISEAPSVTLRHILPVTARRRGGGPAFTLLVGQMSPTTLNFRTAETIAEGDRLNLEMLLQGFGPVSLEARVNWLLLSPNGFHGELQLSGGEGDKIVLEHYLRRQAKDQR